MKPTTIAKGIFNPISIAILVILIGISGGLYYINVINMTTMVSLLILSVLIASSIHIANQWEKAVVLRMGKYQGLKGPGLFLIIPIVDRIDHIPGTGICFPEGAVNHILVFLRCPRP